MLSIVIAAVSRSKSPTGVCRGAISTAQALASLKTVNKIFLVVGDWQIDYFKNLFILNSSKVEFITVSIKNNSYERVKWSLFSLPKLVNKLQTEVLLLSFPMPVINRLFKKKCYLLVIVHDLYQFTEPGNFGYPHVYANQLTFILCINNINEIVFISNHTKENFQKKFPGNNKPYKIIHWYASIKRDEQQSPKDIELGVPYLLMVAQHRKNKNIDLQIRTLYYMKMNKLIKDNIQLFIVGNEGPETKVLKQLVVELNLCESVKFIKLLTDSELAYLYEHCLIVLSPSSTEGFGYTLIESAKFGKRVVCSCIDIFREVGNEYCFYFNLDNNAQENLSDAIINALKTPDVIVHEESANNSALLNMQESYKEIFSKITTQIY